MKNINEYNVIGLAYLGDAVYELYLRDYFLTHYSDNVNELQKKVTQYVRAKGQALILEYLINEQLLSEEELDIVKRGRNYKRSNHPKNTDIITYKLSTGFETLIGWLYKDKNYRRIEELCKEALNENIWKERM